MQTQQPSHDRPHHQPSRQRCAAVPQPRTGSTPVQPPTQARPPRGMKESTFYGDNDVLYE